MSNFHSWRRLRLLCTGHLKCWTSTKIIQSMKPWIFGYLFSNYLTWLRRNMKFSIGLVYFLFEAFGCILFYLVCGYHPFEDSARLAILNSNFHLPPCTADLEPFHNLIRMFSIRWLFFKIRLWFVSLWPPRTLYLHESNYVNFEHTWIYFVRCHIP